jgi:glycosyltransferase involved in cell wall biosynthesis
MPKIKGIKYVGPMFDMSGYAQACRGYILSLHRLGIPITLGPISFEQDKPDLGKDGTILKSLVNKEIDYNVVILHSTPEHWSKLREPNKFNIGYCVWETDKLHPDWIVHINDTVEACMVSCEWNVEVYKNSGIVVPVFSVPHGIDVSEFKDVEPYEIRGVSPDVYKFYSIFQFIERKHPMALIKAYWYAFQNNEKVALILKTYRMGFSPEEKNVIKDTIKRMKIMMPMDNYPPVYLIGDMLSRDQILGLHKSGDCLISLDRGEGFGLVPFEAGASENPIIVTGLGGVTEYAKPEHSFLCKYSLTPVFGMQQSPWYRGDQLWAEPDLGNAVHLMRYVYKHQVEAANKGRMLKQYIVDNLSWDKMGMRMVEGIKSL